MTKNKLSTQGSLIVSLSVVGLVVPFGVDSAFPRVAQAITTCAEPSAPCVVGATLKKSTLRVSLAGSTKVIRVSWTSPSGKPVTRPLPVRKGVAALTIAGIKVGTALPLSLQACTSTKLATCRASVAWTMQVDTAGAVTAIAGEVPGSPAPTPASAPAAAATNSPTTVATQTPTTAVATTTVVATTVAPTTVATTVPPTTTLQKLAAAALTVKVGSGATPALQLLKGSCKTGFVKRNATPTDTVCVTAESASRAFIDNELAKTRIAVSSSGPDGCRQGFVWREAVQGDVVCVTPASNVQARNDNDAQLNLSRMVLFNGPETCKKGFVWRSTYGSIDQICVTPAEKQLVEEEGDEWDRLNRPWAPCPINWVRRLIFDQDDVCVPAARKLKINQDNTSYSTKEKYSIASPDACRLGFVWRLVTPSDHICVPPSTAKNVLAENANATKNKVFSQGPETCIDGFAWRQATPEDRVCVALSTADETQRENDSAKTRVN